MSNPSLWQKTVLMFFGICLAIILLETGLRIGSFTILSIQEYRNLHSIKQKGTYRIMCLGESTTHNEYTLYLENILNQRNIGIKFSVIDKGLGGTNTEAIISLLEPNINKYHPDMVVTMMGINDGGSHMPYEAASKLKIVLAFRSFKIYKLTKLIWLHIKAKSKEIHKEQNLFQKEQALKKDLELNPNNNSAHKELGGIYSKQGRDAEAEQEFKKAIELNPNNDSAHKELGVIYFKQGRDAEAEQEFKKAIGLNPSNLEVYIHLGFIYRRYKRFSEAEQMFKKGLAIQELGHLYISQKRLTEAEQVFKKALELDPDNYIFCGGLGMVYCEMGNNELSKIYAEKADNLRNKSYNPTVFNNYHALRKILDKNNIKLVCVQYPVLSVESLKKIFQEELDGIIFVDNEKIFKNAVKKEGYKEYFRDIFAGDFGHCTEKGNKLLAENIANVILKEAFGK